MVARAITQGLATPARRPALTLLVWVWNFLLALGPMMMLSRWLGDAFGGTMASDPLLNGFNLAVNYQLSQYDRSSVWGVLNTGVVAAVLGAFVLAPLAAGGTLEVLLSRDGRSFMHRFFRGAGHFYYRFLRLSLVVVVAGGVSLLLLSMALAPLVRWISDLSWEPAFLLAGGGQLLLLGLVAAFWLLALDYARIRVAKDDEHGMLRALIGGARFVITRLVGAYTIAVVFWLVLVAVMALYLGYAAVAPSNTTVTIVLLFLVQQFVMIVRAGTRVGRLGAEIEYFDEQQPAPVPIPVPVEEPAAPLNTDPEPVPPSAAASVD